MNNIKSKNMYCYLEWDMYRYLESFMYEHGWEYEPAKIQARAIFTTICVMNNIDADTNICDNMLWDLWSASGLKAACVKYNEFENYMVELIV